jgi:glycosyltransferase involved in cell wall biosynthesis
MKVLIAIPVFNERQYVAGVLAKVRRYQCDLLVIDDGSTDGTAELLRQMADQHQIHLIRHGKNKGYGQSLIDAFGFAQKHSYDWIITMDCDEQHEPEMIPEFLRQIARDNADLSGADIISGSRYLRRNGHDDAPPEDRRRINLKLTRILNDLFGLNLTDAFCGFKAHRVRAMKRLKLDVAGYAFPMQLWPQASAAGLVIREIPVRLIYNDPTRHFGGQLDDADNRLRHYLSVLETEMKRLATKKPERCALLTPCCCEC